MLGNSPWCYICAIARARMPLPPEPAAAPKKDPRTELFVIKQQPKTMAEMAIDVIRSGILSGEFAQGSRLIPGELETRLNLGRVPIREAIKELAGSGLVILHPNKGAVVSPMLSIEELCEVFELRYELEGKAAYRAALHATPEQIARLRALNAISRDTRQLVSYTQANRAFHIELYRTSGWLFLLKTITELYDQMLIIRSYFKHDPDLIERFSDEHDAIIDAVANREPEKARDHTQAHISWLYDRLQEVDKTKYPQK